MLELIAVAFVPSFAAAGLVAWAEKVYIRAKCTTWKVVSGWIGYTDRASMTAVRIAPGRVVYEIGDYSAYRGIPKAMVAGFAAAWDVPAECVVVESAGKHRVQVRRVTARTRQRGARSGG